MHAIFFRDRKQLDLAYKCMQTAINASVVCQLVSAAVGFPAQDRESSPLVKLRGEVTTQLWRGNTRKVRADERIMSK